MSFKRVIPSTSVGRKTRRILAGAVALALNGSAVTVTLPASATASPIPHGGTIHEAVDDFPAGLSPTLVTVNNVAGQQQMEDIYGLLGYEDARQGAVHLVFLKSITPQNGFKTWNLTLHPGIIFSDGTPLNAAAIQYTIEQLANPNNGYPYQSSMTGWKLKVRNTDTLQITLPSADAQFPAEMTQEFPFIASPTAWKAEGTKFATKPVGAGAFTLTSFTPNASMTLAPNPHYWVRGEPYVSKLVVSDFPTSHTQFVNSLTSGEEDFAWLQGSSEVTPAKAAGLQLQNFPLSGGNWLVFNTQKPPFNNVLARRAVTLALDHQELVDAWDPGGTAMKELFSSNSPFYNPKYVNPPQNRAKAQQLFNQLAKEGHPLSFTFTDLAGYDSIGQFIQSHLAQFKNVSVKVQVVQGPVYQTDSIKGTFQMIPQGFFFATPWPSMATGFQGGSAENFGRWNDPAVNRALADLKKTTSAAKERKDWTTVLSQIASQDPIYTSQQALFTTAYAKNVHNVQVIETGTLALMEKVYLS